MKLAKNNNGLKDTAMEYLDSLYNFALVITSDTKQAEDAYKKVLALDKNGVYGKQAGEKLSHDPGPKD